MKPPTFRLNAARILSAAIIMAVPILFQSCLSNEFAKPGTNNSHYRKKNKEKVVKVYPDLFKRIIHVKNKSNENIDFYVFDDEYKIAYHNKLVADDHVMIEKLSAGIYVYEVYAEDIRCEYGKLVIR